MLLTRLIYQFGWNFLLLWPVWEYVKILYYVLILPKFVVSKNEIKDSVSTYKTFCSFPQKQSTIQCLWMRFGSLFFFFHKKCFHFLKIPNLFKWQTFRTQQSLLSISFTMLRVDSITALISHTSYFTQSWSAIFTADLSM